MAPRLSSSAALLELGASLWPSEVAVVQRCIHCARQPSTLYGSPDVLVEDGVDAAAKVTGAWAGQLAAATEGLTTSGAIGAAMRRAAERLNVGALAKALEQQLMRGIMLGALDSAWEGEHEELVALPRFAAPALPGHEPWPGLVKAVPNPAPAAAPGFAHKPYEKALEWFRSKQIVTRSTFDQLEDAAKRKAFTVARMSSLELLKTAQDELAKQVEKGADFRDFRKVAKERLVSAGWTPANPSHLETVFRTNVLGTYGAGRHAQMTDPTVLALRPYWQIVTVNDGAPRQRKTHQAVHLWVLRADDPVWAHLWTPFGMNCRCRIRSLSERQVKKQGLTVRTGSEIKGLPDPGFVSGPGQMLPGYKPKEFPEGGPRPEARPQIAPAKQPLPVVVEQPPPPPPPPPAPVAPPLPPIVPSAPTAAATTSTEILGQKLAGPGGSNPGGVYRGTDGVDRYVKFYTDPSQAHGEVLAGAIYRALGLGAPEGVAFEHEGKLAYASKILPGIKELGKQTLTKPLAKKVMKGFGADVLTANWDAVGLELDNVVVDAAGKVHRIDNGGSMLMRAKAGRKPTHVLNEITEWNGFFNPSLNPAYAKVAKAAGYSSAEDMGKEAIAQVKAIVKLRKKHGSWLKFIEQHAPELKGKDRVAIVDMLEARTKLMQDKISELEAAAKAAKGAKIAAEKQAAEDLARGFVPPKFPAAEVKTHWTALRSVDELPKTGNEAHTDTIKRHGKRTHEAFNEHAQEPRDAIRAFSGSTYGAIRNAARMTLEEFKKKYGEWTDDLYREMKAKVDHIARAFDLADRGVIPKAPAGVVARGFHSLSDEQAAELLSADHLVVGSPVSSSQDYEVARNFMGYEKTNWRVFCRLEQHSGVYIDEFSANKGEREVLIRKGAQFQITRVERQDGNVIVVHAKELPGGAQIPTGVPKPYHLSRRGRAWAAFVSSLSPEVLAMAARSASWAERRERFVADMSDPDNARHSGLLADGGWLTP